MKKMHIRPIWKKNIDLVLLYFHVVEIFNLKLFWFLCPKFDFQDLNI